MSDLIDTTEMYLRTIFELSEEGLVPLRARIAERLGQSGPTVSQTVARMERDGLLVVQPDRRLDLTERGLDLGTRVMRKHRLVERLLTDVIGLDWHLAHDEACRWEHVVSEDVERRLVAILPGVHVDPYGNPIPGLAELGQEAPTAAAGQSGGGGGATGSDGPAGPAGGHPSAGDSAGVCSLAELAQRMRAAGENQRRVTVVRVGEVLQVDVDLLAELQTAGLRPGAATTVDLADNDGRVKLQGELGHATVTLHAEEQRHLYTACDLH